MPDIDPEAAGILIEGGIDPATAYAASIRDQPRGPRKPVSRYWLLLGALLGIVAAVATEQRRSSQVDNTCKAPDASGKAAGLRRSLDH
jgi:hypothetical protein